MVIVIMATVTSFTAVNSLALTGIAKEEFIKLLMQQRIDHLFGLELGFSGEFCIGIY